MQIGPQYAAIHLLGGLQQVMMIVPIDADKDKASDKKDDKKGKP